MVGYAADVRPRVRKALRQLDPPAWEEVLTKMRALATDPRPPELKPSAATHLGSEYE